MIIATYTKSRKVSYIDAYFIRGLAYVVEVKPDLAITDLNKALALDPNYAPAYYARGLAYVVSGDNKRAVIDFNKTLQLSSDPELRQKVEEQLKQIIIK